MIRLLRNVPWKQLHWLLLGWIVGLVIRLVIEAQHRQSDEG
jgi:hypothetical protein